MTTAPTDVLLDPHPDDNSAVLARVGGPRANAARHILLAHTFQLAPGHGPGALVLVRIDREEAHYAEEATRALRKAGIFVGVDFDLQQDFDSDWAWIDYPYPSLNRQEIRAIGAEAQKIHDDITAGRLVIHHHALDADTVAAVGTHSAGYSVHLEGEDHLRQVVRAFDSKDEALADFALIYGHHALRPGPAPATSAERRSTRILTSTAKPTTDAGGAIPHPPAATRRPQSR